MASVQDRSKLKRESCDTWSTREQLCLASSVLKSGDQNWNSVSKSLRPFAEKEALRSADWFSPKSCAIQYAALIENADTPKRKKRENNDITGVTTIGTAIVRRLTAERISELRQILASQRDEYQQLKQEVNLLKSGSITDEKLQKMWQVSEQEDKEAEQKEKAHLAWLAKRQQKQESSARETANLSTPKKTLEIPCEPVDVLDDTLETEEDRKNQGGRSPLLTSLLKSPSPTTQVLNAASTAQTTSPTIASLLGATTKPQTSQVAQNLTSQLNQIVVKSMSSPMPSLTSMSVASTASGKDERPSVGAPTLSMMLQLPSNIPRSLPSQLNNNSTPTTPTASSAPLKSVKTSVNETVRRTVSVPVTPVVDNSPVQVIEPAVTDITDPETIDKDEINEIIDDIEELIKEEISPEAKAASVSIVEPIKKQEEKEKEPVVHTVNQEKIQNLNESESPDLDSSTNDITMELIDQDTAKIAEIIGASPEIQTSLPLVEPEKPIEIKIECVEEKKEEEEKEKSSSSVVTTEEENKTDKEIKTEIIVEENNVPEEKVEKIPEVVEKNKEKESEPVVEKDTAEEIPVEKDVVTEEKEQEQKDEKEQEKDNEKEQQQKDVEVEKENEEKQKEDKKVEEKEEISVEVEEPKKEEEEKVKVEIEPPIEVKETEAKEKEEEKEQQQQQDEAKIIEENIIEKISEKPKESNDVLEVKKSTETSSIVKDNKSVQEVAKKSEPCQDIKVECKEEKIVVEEKKDIVSQSTIKLEVEESKEKESPIEVKVENSTNKSTVKEATVKEPSKTSSPPSTEDIKKEKKEITKILDKPSETNSSPIPTKSKTTTTTTTTTTPTTLKISKPSEDKKVEIKIIKSVQEDQATDVEDKIPHSKIPIRMDINDDKKNDNKTNEKTDKEIKIEDANKKDIVKIKKQETPSVSSIDDIEEEESSMTKLSGRAIKTYSKKQNVAIDSEPETDTSEGADYRAWKKAIILVFNRLATHRFSSLFLKPITEENAPGYHSVVFRPMDLSTIKKNIDNGTIRSTIQFQRDVMLMFQNAIMYNKHDTRVHKMTLDMQEECLEQMQVLVDVAAEGPLRRETRTAANSSINEANDNNFLKRKRSLITPSPLDSDSPRLKKRRKSEND